MDMKIPLTLNLLSIKENINLLEWQSHGTLGRHDTKIFTLYQDNASGQRIALIHCLPGASAKTHLHHGHETFVILDGAFEDDSGIYSRGDLVCYPPGSQHSWRSQEGALIYAVWGGMVTGV